MNFNKFAKYGNKQTPYKGDIYDSKLEAKYAAILDTLKSATNKAQKVVSWERQIPFQIILNGIKICKYFADFKVLYADGREEIIDVKGLKTDVYKLKKKLVEAQYGIEIIEIKKNDMKLF